MPRLLRKLDRIPPFVCRLMARDASGRKPLSYATISARSGIGKSRVAEILVLTSWKGVPVDVADKVADACGVDLTTPGKYYKWLRRSSLLHAKTGTASQRKMFERLLQTRA